ncbi:hypothetical protein C0993_005552 [Termitomyces sp. T159_Od127]|nr:hypothetical protein C0993_005552 [Termitomyces sp. T159_Od127]
MIPKGHQLVVRGVTSLNLLETPVALVKDLLSNLASESGFEHLKVHPLIVSPFSERSSNLSSACYVELRHSVEEAGPKPRVDLLEDIKVVASIFASYGGPQITFLLPANADCFMALGSLAVPLWVSKHVACIEPLKEISIERLILVPWIKRRVPKHSFIESRTTDLNSDLIIFSLALWADTLSILRCGDDFRAKFPETILPPRLLWDYNDNPLHKTLLGDQVSRGADQISSTVSSLVCEVHKLRGEVQSVKAQQADVLANQKVMFNLISDLDHCMSTSQQAILLQSLELQLRSQIGDLKTQASSLCVAIHLSDDTDEKADLQATATEVKCDLALKRQELAGVMGKFESVTGVQPAPALPALASVLPANPATLTHPSAAWTSLKRRKTSLAHMELDGNNGDSTMVHIDHALPLSKCACNLSLRSARASPNDVDPTITAIITSRGTSDGWPGQRRIRAGMGSGLACYRSPSFSAFSNFCTLTPSMPTSCFLNSSSAPVVPLLAFDHATAANSQGIVIVSVAPSCSFPRSSSTIFLTKLILYLLLFSFLVTHTHAQPALPPSQFSVCALNANGLVSPIKLAHVGAMLTKLIPHFFALSETKTRSSTGSRLPLSNYEIFEELGVQCSSLPLAKWGIVLGIRKDIQVVARVPLSGISLCGQVVAVDVIIPLPAGALVPHRVFAVFPGKLDKHKFSQFAETVDRTIEADKGNLEADVTTDASFDKKVTSPLIQRLVARTRHLGGAISIARGHAWLFSYGSLQLHNKLRLEFDLKGGGPVDSFTDFLIEARHACHRDLYVARKAEIIARAQRYNRGQIIRVLQGTSSKKLLGSASKFVPLPTALHLTQSTGVIETEPSAVVNITRKYFTDLYKRSPPLDKPKPWLTTPSVAAVRQRVEQDPFMWPVLATLLDFRAMLRKGNP